MAGREEVESFSPARSKGVVGVCISTRKRGSIKSSEGVSPLVTERRRERRKDTQSRARDKETDGAEEERERGRSYT